MSKAPVDIIKYVIHAEAEANGLIEKPDLIGAIFGQTEGLLGEDLDLRELQKSGRIGRIDAELETKKGVTKAEISIPSSLDMVVTSIIAAGVETITRVGPCDAKFKILQVEDVREAKRKDIVDRARQILKTFMTSELPDSKEISEELRHDMRSGDITKYKGLDAGPAIESSEGIILVEGRADVLNLLRNGIKNSIAVGGIKIPKEISNITKDKVVTAFVDGDRGGDLILKSLKNAGVKIDNIARAPPGREVEDLSRKDVIMALRRKKVAEDIFKELEGVSGRSSKRESKPSEGRSSSRRSDSRSSRGRRDSEGEGSSRERSIRDRSTRERSSRDRSSRDKPPRDRAPRDRPSRDSSRDRGRRPPREAAPEKPSESGMLLEKLGGIKNQAMLLNDKFEEMKILDLDMLSKEKGLKKAHALIVDDIVTNDILKLAEKCKFVVGITTAGNLSAPRDKVIVTKF